jgi:hypothetical protein
VPAPLLRDLRRWAWEADDRRLALLLLALDVDGDDGSTPVRLVVRLVDVARRLARSERRALAFARAEARDAFAGTSAPADVAGALGIVDSAAALQRRVGRVVGGLLLTVRSERGAARAPSTANAEPRVRNALVQ